MVVCKPTGPPAGCQSSPAPKCTRPPAWMLVVQPLLNVTVASLSPPPVTPTSNAKRRSRPDGGICAAQSNPAHSAATAPAATRGFLMPVLLRHDAVDRHH